MIASGLERQQGEYKSLREGATDDLLCCLDHSLESESRVVRRSPAASHRCYGKKMLVLASHKLEFFRRICHVVSMQSVASVITMKYQ